MSHYNKLWLKATQEAVLRNLTHFLLNLANSLQLQIKQMLIGWNKDKKKKTQKNPSGEICEMRFFQDDLKVLV